MVRPRTDTGAEDSENPMGMDNLLRTVGIETPDWYCKTECCGASSLLNNPEISKIRIRDVLISAQASGADAIAVACPLCHMNLEMTLEDQGKKIPVVYFTQLLGLALGCNVKDVELNKMLVQYDWDSKLI
ncbi:8-methylmenaquinol:fumarate reductase membrane anchor subunit [bioreactor metagenome]|uniref:8-methylmenaquinol:fumarate reductase membrane anchor subunit n=1 Tax=bioreactor metagenome TaxID=1076179 RepID=A0A645FSZ9_9ZZZZ